MESNSYILSWTMNEYDRLLVNLAKASFAFLKEKGKDHVRIAVPFSRWEEFADLVQPHLNAPYNYVDITYPEDKLIIIFGVKRFVITNKEENEAAKKWAIDLGLPTKQADWTHWFK